MTSPRLHSLDAYRGFIMLAMVSEGFGFTRVARQLPDQPLWQFLGFQFEHVTWMGCSFWDLIQPSFMFMVGVALPYSHASRVAHGQKAPLIAAHVLYRALVLILLGIFLASNWSPQTEWVFTNVLTQIGLGYCLVYLLAGRGVGWQLLSVVAILVASWFFFYQYPASSPAFDYGSVGFPASTFTPFTGLFAHWNPNTNAAAAFDDWFLNLWPRAQPFHFNRGGYATLNFVPSMATMLLGVAAGQWLRRGDLTSRQKLLGLSLAALLCGSLGLLLGETVCPIVKRIWTPSWTLYSAGWTFVLLAVFYVVIDVVGWRGWSVPLIAVGMNSIAVYCMSQLLKPWVRDTCKRHLGRGIFDGTYGGYEFFDPLYAPVAERVTFFAVVWLTAVWMYRRGIFIKI